LREYVCGGLAMRARLAKMRGSIFWLMLIRQSMDIMRFEFDL